LGRKYKKIFPYIFIAAFVLIFFIQHNHFIKTDNSVPFSDSARHLYKALEYMRMYDRDSPSQLIFRDPYPPLTYFVCLLFFKIFFPYFSQFTCLFATFILARFFCDTPDILPQWCPINLAQHLPDSREYFYSTGQLEGAETHDLNWDAAQTQMVLSGFLQRKFDLFI